MKISMAIRESLCIHVLYLNGTLKSVVMSVVSKISKTKYAKLNFIIHVLSTMELIYPPPTFHNMGIWQYRTISCSLPKRYMEYIADE